MKILFLFTISVLSTVNCRKYDIDAEAIKLYGEDLKSVLLRFRKSPDYLNIMKDKVEDMKEKLKEMTFQVHKYCETEMYIRIGELLVSQGIYPVPDVQSLRSQFHPRSSFDPIRDYLRQDKKKMEDMNPIKRLDHYSMLHQGLPTADINYFKDVGFEYAGRLFHTIIKHMGSDDTPIRSTQQPYGGGHIDQSQKSTTEHVHDHQVKTSPNLELTVTATNAPPTIDSFKYKYKEAHNKINDAT